MKVITWNINSVRLRAGLVHELIQAEKPDVLCLQETKVENAHSPMDLLKSTGMEHIVFHGEKSYNGVCILSKKPVEAWHIRGFAKRQDCRHIGAKIGGIYFHNLYVPAGGDIPDPELNPKFAHKLAFVDDAIAWAKETINPSDPVIALGDFNIAPLEHDVWSHKQLLDVVSHTPIEVEKLTRFQQSVGWVDSSRQFTPESQKLYSWWSYRNRDWKKSDRGRRLDHIWLTPALRHRLKEGYILKPIRDWKGPSDHVPVVIRLAE